MFELILGNKGGSKLIVAAFADISQMLKDSEEMVELALAGLLDNVTLTVDLDAMDDRVDEGERMVRRTVLEHLSVNPSQELVSSLILVSMVQDAERVGDFARGLAELIPLAEQPREGHFADRLRQLAGEIMPLFEICREGFSTGDSAKAGEVMSTWSALKPQMNAYVKEVAGSDLPANMAVVYASGARILRRIAAHLSNIASAVVQPYDRIRHGDEDV
ncbi:MAG: PhoU domain-containing protein [Thermoanaerobaculia bacterium]